MIVGDSVIDWQTARAAGTRVCLARYGFGFSSVPLTDLSSDDQVIDAPVGLLAL